MKPSSRLKPVCANVGRRTLRLPPITAHRKPLTTAQNTNQVAPSGGAKPRGEQKKKESRAAARNEGEASVETERITALQQIAARNEARRCADMKAEAEKQREPPQTHVVEGARTEEAMEKEHIRDEELVSRPEVGAVRPGRGDGLTDLEPDAAEATRVEAAQVAAEDALAAAYEAEFDDEEDDKKPQLF